MLFENQAAEGRYRIGPGAPIIREWRNQVTSFDGLGIIRPFGSFTLTGRGQPEVLRSSAISASVFPLLGIQPLIGRGFLPDEEVPGKNNVVLLSYELWQQRFGGDPGIIGQSLTLDLVPRTAFYMDARIQACSSHMSFRSGARTISWSSAGSSRT